MFIDNLNPIQSLKPYEINDKQTKKDLIKDESNKKKYKKNQKKYKNSDKGNLLDAKV